MTIDFSKKLFAILIVLLTVGAVKHASAQMPSTCAKIEAILVAACGTPEGQNEMLRFQIGAAPMNTANLSIRWATTAVPWSGVVQNAGTAAKVDSINHQITGCGWVLEPTGGILPAGAQVIIVTSYAMVTSYNSFANLKDTVYMLFHNSTNTTGHFKNFSAPCSSNCGRTTILTFSGAGGCVDSAVYRIDSLRNSSGNYGSSTGATVNFNLDGSTTYFNDGCQAPFLIPHVYANSDTPTVHTAYFSLCHPSGFITLKAKYEGNFKSYHWRGGLGTLSQPDSLTTNYTPSPLEVMPIRFIFDGKFSCPDSIADTLYVFIVPPLSRTVFPIICEGGSYTVGTHVYTTPGTYHDTLTRVNGCDSLITTNLTVQYRVYDTLRMNQCDTASYRGQGFNTSVAFSDTMRTQFGCDSVIRAVYITIRHSSILVRSLYICSGQSVSVGPYTHSTSGIYIDTLGNSQGCDSLVFTFLNVITPSNQSMPLTSCVPLTYGGHVYATDTTVNDTIRSLGGCDSIRLSVNIHIATVAPTNLNPSICLGQSYNVGIHSYNATGIYHDTLSSVLGCDSIINTNLTVLTPTTGSQSLSDCGQVTFKGITYTANATVPDTLRSSLGCDSVYVTVTITITHAVTYAQSLTKCPGQSVTVGTHSYSSAGTYIDTIPIVASTCDSIITTTLSYITASTTTLSPIGCGSVTYRGLSYTSSTTIIDTLKSAGGCDSIITTANITVNQATTFTQSITICQGQTYSVGSNNHTTTGQYIDIIPNSHGCDSTVTTNLSVIIPVNVSDTMSGCDSVIFRGTTYRQPTVVSTTISSVGGCDSIITATHIVILRASTFTQRPTICNGQSFNVGIHTYSATGTYTDLLSGVNAVGCDSLVTTILTVLSPSTPLPLNLNSNCQVTYRGRTYTANAIIHDTLRSLGGCDSIYQTVNISINPSTNRNSVSVCRYVGQSYFAGGQNQTTSGTYIDTFRTSVGACDSAIVTTDLRFITTQSNSITLDSCRQVTYNGVVHTSSTTLRDTVRSAFGCDSIVTTVSITIVTSSITIVSSAILPIHEGDSTQLSISPSGSYQNIVWSPNSDISNIHVAAPFVSPVITTAYSVIAEDANHCPVNASIVVTVIPSDASPFIMPTAFSPNGDGSNDSFGPVLRTGSEILLFHVYNRWGELVFDKEFNGTAWDGFYKAVAQPIGVYTYFITVKGANGRIESKQGNLTLIR